MSHQCLECAGCRDGGDSIFWYVGAGCPPASDSFCSAAACCAAVALELSEVRGSRSGKGVLEPVLASVLACVARREAACWRVASARTCLRFLFRRDGFHVVDLKGRGRTAMSSVSWMVGPEDAGVFGVIVDVGRGD